MFRKLCKHALPVCFALALIFASFLSPFTSASAVSLPSFVLVDSYEEGNAYSYFDPSTMDVLLADYSFITYRYTFLFSELPALTVTGAPVLFPSPIEGGTVFQVIWFDLGDPNLEMHIVDFGETITFPDGTDPFNVIMLVQSANPDIRITVASEGLYGSAWDMFVKFIYGENAMLTPEQNLTLTLLATIAVLAVVLIPFAVVYFVLRFIFGWR